MTVLMVIMLPVVGLVMTATKVVSGNEYRLNAQLMAQSWVTQVQSASSPSSTLAPPTSCTSYPCQWTLGSGDAVQLVSSSSPAWPTSSTATTTIGTETYAVYVVAGWCAASGSSSAEWTNGTPTAATNPVSLMVAAKVVWGKGTSSSVGPGLSKVVRDVLQSQSWWTVPASTPASIDCPANLT